MPGKQKKNSHGINDKQLAVADLFRGSPDESLRGNLSACYKKIYKCGDKAAHTAASRLLKNAKFVEYINKKQKAVEEAADVDALRVFKEMCAGALIDLGQLFDKNGNVRPIQDLPEWVRRGITGVKMTKGKNGRKVFEYKTDKTKFTEMLGRYYKMFTDKFEVDVGKTLEQIIAESMKPKDNNNEKDNDKAA